MDRILNYINGQLQPPFKGAFLNNVEPATGKTYSLVPDSDAQDVAQAVEAAVNASSAWAAMPVEKRSALLLKVAELIEKNHHSLALAESKDNGKPLKLASVVDIPRASHNLRFYATAALHDSANTHQQGQVLNYTRREPIGVAGCISPWNLPLYLFTWKIAPALASGNAVVAKPSELTPMTAFLLSELCIEAGLPPGVLNIVHGLGPKVGQAIVEHPQVPVISFTGGTKTGEHLARTAAPMFKKLSLELGGKNPNIIFADCDLDKAVHTSLQSSFANQGQICLCGSRIFIEREIYDAFKLKFLEGLATWKVGDPEEDGVKMGALVSKPHLDKVLSYVHLARQEGGNILFGGEQINLNGRCEGGYFMQPTVIEGLAYDCRTNMEEIFGPVVTLTPFDNEDEVVHMANATRYGLAATVWTENLNKAHRVAHALKSGIVWVNCWLVRDLRTPFGGVKQSGVGREGGFEALHFFTEEKNVCIQLS
jgi:aminomuconate-semialdehyde/2-hydroxymuconate-6-semialdehyde dehydrogenase